MVENEIITNKQNRGESMFRKLLDKRIVGIWLVIVFDVVFGLVSMSLRGYLDGTIWFVVSSLQRVLFGVAAVIIYLKCFDKENWKEVINFKGFGKGLFAGSGVILVTLYLAVYIVVGTSDFIGLTIPLIISQLLCQQITTGFYEEITYRGLVVEGYFYQRKQNIFARLGYASISSIIFGLAHAIYRTSFEQGIYVFITTGIMGFAFAAIYLYSHNLLAPMILHAVYDIPANLLRYVEWNNAPAKLALDSVYDGVFPFIFIVALVFVIMPRQKKSYMEEGKIRDFIREY